jgi:hypothetical protein
MGRGGGWPQRPRIDVSVRRKGGRSSRYLFELNVEFQMTGPRCDAELLRSGVLYVRRYVRSTYSTCIALVGQRCCVRGCFYLRSTERLAGAALIPSGVTWHAASTYSSTGHMHRLWCIPPVQIAWLPSTLDAPRWSQPGQPGLLRPGIIACNFSSRESVPDQVLFGLVLQFLDRDGALQRWWFWRQMDVCT